MKLFVLTILVILACWAIRCEERSIDSTAGEGFIIGFDPCTAVADPNGGELGVIISLNQQRDTVVAYNFPPDIYTFPTEYFVDYRSYCFFPDSAQNDYPIKMKYRQVTELEKMYPLCRSDILTGYFDQENQITILSITK